MCLKAKLPSQSSFILTNTTACCHLQRAFGVRKGALRFYAKKKKKTSKNLDRDLHIFPPKSKKASAQLFFFETRPELQRDRRALHHHAVRQFRPRLGSGHPGRLPGVHGAAPRRVPAAVAAPVDGDAG